MTTQPEPEVNEDGLIVVRSRDEIPTHFANADDEAAWWETHDLDRSAFPLRPADDNPRLRRFRAELAAERAATSGTTAINVRLESDVLERLKRLATARGLGYQTLLKRFIVERLYEEERHGA